MKIKLNKKELIDYFLKFKLNEKFKNINLFNNFNKYLLELKLGQIGNYNGINSYEKNINFKGNFAQNGEDMVLNYIFKKIGITNKYFVEFGGYDGKTFSNTLYFKKILKWNGLLLEGDLEKMNKLNRKELEEYNIKNEFITSKNINEIFFKYNVPTNFDLLSIDVDSDDFYIFKALNYKPRIVVIETNPGLPNIEPLIVKENKSIPEKGYFGANLIAFYRLLKNKNYEFVTTVRWNAIFIFKAEFSKLDINTISENECIEKYFKPNNYWINIQLKNLDNDWNNII